jgi:hypothetical protein
VCNAWNHDVWCNCGWGAQAATVGAQYDPSPPEYASYVNPNASCPVCHAAVFFYQSPDGGRVFFDELGPPWPKHPCTDAPSTPIRHPPPQHCPQRNAWAKEGWLPLRVVELRENQDRLRLSGRVQQSEGDDGTFIFFDISSFPEDFDVRQLSEIPLLIRAMDRTKREIELETVIVERFTGSVRMVKIFADVPSDCPAAALSILRLNPKTPPQLLRGGL